MVNGNLKGKVGEREACKAVEEALNLTPGTLGRSQQYSGKGESSADIIGLPGIHFEVKRTETLNLYKALEQAVSDSKNGNVPTVIHRRNRKDWVLIIRLNDLPKLIERLSDKETSNVRKIRRTLLCDRVLPSS